MEQEKFLHFCDIFENAFQKIVNHIPGLELVRMNEAPKNITGKQLSSVVGVVGMNKGRIHVEMGTDLVKTLFELVNGESPEDEMDLCFYLAELTNTITGNGITILNNTYKGINLRLTPPAIFAGDNLDITTPRVQSAARFYTTRYGTVKIEIGFEGV